jgi:hypothetical protein
VTHSTVTDIAMVSALVQRLVWVGCAPSLLLIACTGSGHPVVDNLGNRGATSGSGYGSGTSEPSAGLPAGGSGTPTSGGLGNAPDGGSPEAGPDATGDAVSDTGFVLVGVDATSPSPDGSIDAGTPAPPIDAAAFAGLCALDPSQVYVKGFLAAGYRTVTGIAPVTDLGAWCSYYESSGINYQIRPTDGALLFSPGSAGIVRFNPPAIPIEFNNGVWQINAGNGPISVSTLCVGPSNYPYDFRVDPTGNLIAQCFASGTTPPWSRDDGGVDYGDIVIHAMGPNDLKLVESGSVVDGADVFQPAVLDATETWSRASTLTTFPGPLTLARWGTDSFLVVYAISASPGDYELWKVATDATPTRVGQYASRPTMLTGDQALNTQMKLDRDGALYERYPIFNPDGGLDIAELVVQKRPLAPAATQVLVRKEQYQSDPKASPPILRVTPETLVTGP